MKGTFQITSWDENTFFEGENETKQSYAKVRQNYTGDIEGSSTVQYLMAYQSKSLAVFSGLETIEGKFNDKEGTVVLKHEGKFKNGIASSQFEIINAYGQISGLSGKGVFKSTTGGKANYEIETIV